MAEPRPELLAALDSATLNNTNMAAGLQECSAQAALLWLDPQPPEVCSAVVWSLKRVYQFAAEQLVDFMGRMTSCPQPFSVDGAIGTQVRHSTPRVLSVLTVRSSWPCSSNC